MCVIFRWPRARRGSIASQPNQRGVQHIAILKKEEEEEEEEEDIRPDMLSSR